MKRTLTDEQIQGLRNLKVGSKMYVNNMQVKCKWVTVTRKFESEVYSPCHDCAFKNIYDKCFPSQVCIAVARKDNRSVYFEEVGKAM